MPGFHGSGVTASVRRRRLRLALSGRDDPRHGPRPVAPVRASRHHPLDVGHRRLDGRDAGDRVGGHVPPTRQVARGDRHVHAGVGAADRVGRHRPAGDPSRSGVAWRRLLRRRARRRSPAGPRDRPDGRPGHVPQRQRVHRPVRPRARRQDADRRHARHVATLRGRALPGVPRRQVGEALRHEQLPGDLQGDGPARRGTRSRHALACDGPGDRADAGRRHLERHALSGVPATPDRRHPRDGRWKLRIPRDRFSARPRRVPDQRRPARGPLERFLANASKSDL